MSSTAGNCRFDAVLGHHAGTGALAAKFCLPGLLELAGSVHKMGDMTRGKPQLNCANTTGVTLTGMDLACGQVQLQVGIEPDIFFKILGEETDLPITDEASLLPCMRELAKAKAAS